MSIHSMSMRLWDGGTPMNSPSWVPVTLHRAATMSPSSTALSTSTWMSGKPVRNVSMNILTPSIPSGMPGGASWSTTSSVHRLSGCDRGRPGS